MLLGQKRNKFLRSPANPVGLVKTGWKRGGTWVRWMWAKGGGDSSLLGDISRCNSRRAVGTSANVSPKGMVRCSMLVHPSTSSDSLRIKDKHSESEALELTRFTRRRFKREQIKRVTIIVE